MSRNFNNKGTSSSRYSKTNKSKKSSFFYLKILSVLLLLTILFFLSSSLSNVFNVKAYAEPLANTQNSNTVERATGKGALYENYTANNLNTESGYLKEQAHLLKNIERVDINTALSMNYYDIVNLYPDSVNSANALQSNFFRYSSVLPYNEKIKEESLVNDICSNNTTFINNIITYSSLINSGASSSQIAAAKNEVQNSFDNVTNLINANMNIF